MVQESVDLNRYMVALCEAPYRWVKRTLEELPQEQLYYQPTPDTNSIAWLVWHLSRWRDRISAAVAGEPEVWVGDGWADRFGMTADRTGLGDTPEQVASFRPGLADLSGYAEAAHQALVQRVSRLTPQQWEAEIEYQPGSRRPAWRALVSVVEDSAEHTGQVNYLRGMLAGQGWR
jgi:hypothetical protein